MQERSKCEANVDLKATIRLPHGWVFEFDAVVYRLEKKLL